MLAFTNTTHTKESAVTLAKWHKEQDSYARGTSGEQTLEDWRDCSVDRMAKGKYADYPELFGIDSGIARIADNFCGKISKNKYKNYTVELFESVKESIDTTIVFYKFTHWMLLDAKHGVITFSQHESIRLLGELLLRASKGQVIMTEQWRDSATAYAAATGAYIAANAGATSAAGAQNKRYDIMADKLNYFLAGGE